MRRLRASSPFFFRTSFTSSLHIFGIDDLPRRYYQYVLPCSATEVKRRHVSAQQIHAIAVVEGAEVDEKALLHATEAPA